MNFFIVKMEDKERKVQEKYIELKTLEQHIKELQSQLEMVTNQLFELTVTSNSIGEFSKINSGKEVFVPLSSGIFAKAAIKDTSELLVNVGANIVVKKDIASTKKLIQDQAEEIKKVQSRMVNELEKIANHAAQLESQLQSLVSQQYPEQ